MRILMLVHRIPYPPDKGDKIRSYHWLEALRERHEIHLVTFVDDAADLAHVDELKKRTASTEIIPIKKWSARLRTAATLLSSRPLSYGHFYWRRAQEAVDRILDRGTDLVFAYSSSTAFYLDRQRSRPPCIMDMVDVDSAKFADYAQRTAPPKSFAYATEARRLGRYEEEIARTWDATLLCTEPEAALLKGRCPGARVEAITNGVSLPKDPDLSPRRSKMMIFIGAMDYFANVDAVVYAAREILPLIRKKVEGAEFHIIGRNPSPEVTALRSLPGVFVTGGVPDIGKYLREGRLALVPLRIAQGIQNKVLEAMAWGVPTVTTQKIVASLGQGAGDCLLAGDTPQEIADRATLVLEDDGAARRLAASARGFVEANFSWPPLYRRLHDLVDDVVARRASR